MVQPTQFRSAALQLVGAAALIGVGTGVVCYVPALARIVGPSGALAAHLAATSVIVWRVSPFAARVGLAAMSSIVTTAAVLAAALLVETLVYKTLQEWSPWFLLTAALAVNAPVLLLLTIPVIETTRGVVLRRRKRRKACAACGHPLGDQDACAECGTSRTERPSRWG